MFYRYTQSRQGANVAAVITDPEDPKFDLEKVIESWTKDS